MQDQPHIRRENLQVYALLVEYCTRHVQDPGVEAREREHGVGNTLLHLAGHQIIAYENPALRSGNQQIDQAYDEVMTQSEANRADEPKYDTLGDVVRRNGMTTKSLRAIAYSSPHIVVSALKAQGIEKQCMFDLATRFRLADPWIQAIEVQYKQA